MSAILSTLVNTSGKMSERLEMGEPYDITIKLTDGILILRVMASRVCCGIMLPKNINIPYFEIKIDELSKRVKKILFES